MSNQNWSVIGCWPPKAVRARGFGGALTLFANDLTSGLSTCAGAQCVVQEVALCNFFWFKTSYRYTGFSLIPLSKMHAHNLPDIWMKGGTATFYHCPFWDRFSNIVLFEIDCNNVTCPGFCPAGSRNLTEPCKLNAQVSPLWRCRNQPWRGNGAWRKEVLEKTWLGGGFNYCLLTSPTLGKWFPFWLIFFK